MDEEGKSINAQLLYEHVGAVDRKALDQMLYSVDSIVDSLEVSFVQGKRIRCLAVEMLQNLYHHAIHHVQGTVYSQYAPVFRMWSREDGRICFESNNLVTAARALSLALHVAELNALDEQGLREKYQAVLQNSMFSSTGGGGLGIILIARRCELPLDVQFFDVDEKYKLFCFRVVVPKNQLSCAKEEE